MKLIPVGVYQDNFYVCLDIRNTTSYDDAPITLFDLVYATLCENPVSKNHLFSSFNKLLESMIDYMETKDILNFKKIDKDSHFPNA